MVHNFFYNSKTAKIDSNITNISKGVLRYECTIFIVFIVAVYQPQL